MKGLSTYIVNRVSVALSLLLAGITMTVFTACTSEEPVQSAPPAYRISIPASFGEDNKTRAVSYNSETGALNAEFTTSDIIIATIISEGDNQTATTILKPDKSGNTANLVPRSGSSVIFRNPTDPPLTENPTPVTLTGNETLFLEYHASAINEFFDYTGLYTVPVGTPQVGTLDNLSIFDYATATVQVTGITGDATSGYALTTTKASFVNQQSMYKFTFTGLPSGVGVKTVVIHSAQDKLVAAYSPTLLALGISVVTNPTYGDITIDLGSAATASNSTVYAALRFAPLDSETARDVITFTVTGTDGKTYTATKTSPAGGFKNGNYYTSTVSLDTYRVYTAKDVYTYEPIPANATAVTSTTYPWSAGTYVVKGDVTISNNVSLKGNVKLILKDGASLTIGGYICGSNNTTYSLEIYGQAAGTGKLLINNSSGLNYAGMTVKNLTVHGGETEVKTNRSSTSSALDGISSSGPITVYNGIVTASSTYGCGIYILKSNLIVYGGEVNATTSKGDAIQLYNSDGCTHTDMEITGGSVTARSTNGSGVHVRSGKGDKITIDGGSLTVFGGNANSSSTMCGMYIDPYNGETNILVKSGKLDITGGDAVSGKFGRVGLSIWGYITVDGGTLTVHGGAGSDTESGGHGIYFATAGYLTVNGGTVNITGGKSANGICGSVGTSIQRFNGGQSSVAGGEGSKAFNKDVQIKSGMAAYCGNSLGSTDETVQGTGSNVTLNYRYVDIH